MPPTQWKYPKSLLRYPGGKSRAVKIIMPVLLQLVDKYSHLNKQLLSPFLGGGSIELAFATRFPAFQVIGSDLFLPLITFWQELKYHQGEVASKTAYLWDALDHCAPEEILSFLKRLRENVHLKSNPSTRAASYYILNRCSYSGMGLSGGFSRNPSNARCTYTAVQRLEKFKAPYAFHPLCGSFEWMLDKLPDAMVYADPPYIIKNKLYGVNGDLQSIDHVLLSQLLKKRNHPWLLSYNDCEEVRSLYDDCYIKQVSWSYGASKQKKDNQELLISNIPFYL